MFGGITGALVVQNKPSLLLLAQAYSVLRVHVHVLMCVCLFMCCIGGLCLCILEDEWLFICFKAALSGWLW